MLFSQNAARPELPGGGRPAGGSPSSSSPGQTCAWAWRTMAVMFAHIGAACCWQRLAAGLTICLSGYPTVCLHVVMRALANCSCHLSRRADTHHLIRGLEFVCLSCRVNLSVLPCVCVCLCVSAVYVCVCVLSDFQTNSMRTDRTHVQGLRTAFLMDFFLFLSHQFRFALGVWTNKTQRRLFANEMK